MSEIRFARIAEAYSTCSSTCSRPQRTLRGNPFRDTIQISTEAQQKSREFLSKINEEPPSQKSSPKIQTENGPDILQLSTNATRDQIRKAYLTAIKKYHPDNFAGLCPEFRKLAEEKSKQINLVYEHLTGT